LAQRVASAQCEANLRRLGLAGRLYAADYNGRFPPDWAAFAGELAGSNPEGPQFLYCPADPAHPTPPGWAAVDFAAVSYALVTPGLREGDWQRVFARCVVHSNVVFADGMVRAARPYDPRPIPLANTGVPVFNSGSLRTRTDAAWSIRCLNQLTQIGLATRLYANDNEGRLPPSFEAITAELGRANILVCPADLLQPRPDSFADLDFGAVSYRLDAPGVRLSPDQVGVRVASCRIHGHSVDSEGSNVGGTDRYPPRLILGHPLSQTVTPGQPATLAVLTGDPGLGPFRFRWHRVELFDAAGLAITNTVELVGATHQTHAIPAASAADEGYYEVIVETARGERQLSHLAYVRVEAVDNPLAVDGWETAACTANLYGLLLASRLAQSSQPAAPDDRLPSQVPALAPFLGWPIGLYCPSDASRVAPDTWNDADGSDISYLICRGVSAQATNQVFATCKVHGRQVLADGRTANPGPDAIRPRFEGPVPLPDGGFRLAVRGIAGIECLIEVSSDLRTWRLLARDWLNDGSLSVIDAVGPATAARFYRARYP
jgi:hypothetical protein